MLRRLNTNEMNCISLTYPVTIRFVVKIKNTDTDMRIKKISA